MASVPDDPSAMPGEPDIQPDMQSTVDQVNSAINQGYSYDDVAAFHADNNLPQPPQPSLDAIMSGNTSDASQWSQPEPGGGNDPTRLDTNVRTQIDQIAESGFGVGAIEGVGMRAAQMGVETTTEGLLGRMTPAGLAAERAAAVANTVAAKAKIPLAAGAAAATMTGNRTLSLDDDLFKGTPAPRRPRGPENSDGERTI